MTFRFAYKENTTLEWLRLKRPPHMGEVLAAQAVIKQIEDGKRPGERVTPFLRWVADYGMPGFEMGPVVIEDQEDQP